MAGRSYDANRRKYVEKEEKAESALASDMNDILEGALSYLIVSKVVDNAVEVMLDYLNLIAAHNRGEDVILDAEAPELDEKGKFADGPNRGKVPPAVEDIVVKVRPLLVYLSKKVALSGNSPQDALAFLIEETRRVIDDPTVKRDIWMEH